MQKKKKENLLQNNDVWNMYLYSRVYICIYSIVYDTHILLHNKWQIYKCNVIYENCKLIWWNYGLNGR